MITGLVNSRFEAICPFSIQDVNGQYHDLEAILDTGFSGWLTLPPGVIAALALAFDGHTIVLLADGSTQMRARYSATLFGMAFNAPLLSPQWMVHPYWGRNC